MAQVSLSPLNYLKLKRRYGSSSHLRGVHVGSKIRAEQTGRHSMRGAYDLYNQVYRLCESDCTRT